MAQVHTCAHDVRHYAALMGARHGPYGGSILAISGCNLGCRRRRRPSGSSPVAIKCIVVRMMAEARRHHGRQASSLCADAPRHHHLTSRIGITSGTTRDAPRDRGRGSASRRADCSQARRRVTAARARVCTGAPTRCAIAERSRGAASFAVGARRLFAVSVTRPARSWRAIRARYIRAHRPRS